MGISCYFPFLYHHFAQQAVGKTTGHDYWRVASHLGSGRSCEVQGFVVRGAADPLGAGFVPAISTSRRRAFSASGIASSIVSDGVFGLGEYLKAKTASYPTSSSRPSVSAKSASVSPGKPTMTSVVMLISRLVAFIHAMRSRYCSRL